MLLFHGFTASLSASLCMQFKRKCFDVAIAVRAFVAAGGGVFHT